MSAYNYLKGKRFFSLTALLLGMQLLLGCADQATSVKQDRVVLLEENHGYLLIAVDTNRALDQIQVTGKQNILFTSEDLKQGSNYILTPLSAGNYQIKRISLTDHIYLRLKKGMWDFSVSPNQISYVGHLQVEQVGPMARRAFVELENRSSEALEFLEKDFPNILNSRRLVYRGPGEDGFLTFIQQQEGR